MTRVDIDISYKKHTTIERFHLKYIHTSILMYNLIIVELPNCIIFLVWTKFIFKTYSAKINTNLLTCIVMLPNGEAYSHRFVRPSVGPAHITLKLLMGFK